MQTLHLLVPSFCVQACGPLARAVPGWVAGMEHGDGGQLSRTQSRESALGLGHPGPDPLGRLVVGALPSCEPSGGHCAGGVNPQASSAWTEQEPAAALWEPLSPARCGLLLGLSVLAGSQQMWVLIYAFYSSLRRCYRSLRTEIKLCILQVQIYCTYSFTVSLQGGSINLVTVKFLRKLIPSSWGYSQLVFGGGVIGI